MSIRQGMRPVLLQHRITEISPTGADSISWEDIGQIEVSISKTSNTLMTQSVRYNESSHVGLTLEKKIEEFRDRLVDGEAVYEIASADTTGRITVLLLKAVDTDAG